jgi:hypothetical protein
MISDYKQFQVHPDSEKLFIADIQASKLLKSKLSMYHSCLFIFLTILNSDDVVLYVLKSLYNYFILSQSKL